MTQSQVGGRIDRGLFLLLVVASQGFVGFLPDRSLRISGVLSAAVLTFLVMVNPDRALSALLSRPIVMFLAFWLVVTALLSSRPEESMYVAVVFVLMAAYLLQLQSTTEQILQTFALASSVALVPSLIGFVAPLGVPVLSQAGSSGGYAGYFPWNSTAGLCAVAALMSIAALLVNGDFMWWHLPAGVGATVALVLAQSSVSLVTLVAVAGAMALNAVLARVGAAGRRGLVIFGFSILGATAAWFVDYEWVLVKLSDVTDRDVTLNVRSDLWERALDVISESPLIGYGSGMDWSDKYRSAHNGFLDLALNAGVPAFFVVAIIILIAGFRLSAARSPLIPFLAYGVVPNLGLSVLALPALPSIALWVAIGSAYRVRSAAAIPGNRKNSFNNGDQFTKAKGSFSIDGQRTLQTRRSVNGRAAQSRVTDIDSRKQE